MIKNKNKKITTTYRFLRRVVFFIGFGTVVFIAMFILMSIPSWWQQAPQFLHLNACNNNATAAITTIYMETVAEIRFGHNVNTKITSAIIVSVHLQLQPIVRFIPLFIP